ncbi:MAG: methyltransferase [FCB group bacterium]|nr:methyltransferase [FCB group bacterium]
MTEIISPEIQVYCARQSAEPGALLKELSDYTFSHTDHPRMVSGSDVGNFLQFVCRLLKAVKVLDIGTFTGYSALTLAEALEDNGKVHTFEMDINHKNIAERFFERSDHKEKIILHFGPALTALKKFVKDTFDMAFIDADKENYFHYYERCLELVKIGGVIILDNMLWSGTVLDPVTPEAVALRKLGDHIRGDERVTNFLLPVRDGLMICRRVK